MTGRLLKVSCASLDKYPPLIYLPAVLQSTHSVLPLGNSAATDHISSFFFFFLMAAYLVSALFPKDIPKCREEELASCTTDENSLFYGLVAQWEVYLEMLSCNKLK